MTLIKARGLSKTYRRADRPPGIRGSISHLFRPRFEEKCALKPLDLDIEEGEQVAYLGPNGAGKSTTIKLLTGVLKPSQGSVRVAGLDPYRNRHDNARNIGVVFGQRSQLWWDLTIQDSLVLLGEIYRLDTKQFRSTFDELVEAFSLRELLPIPARQLSLGQRMRCDLAASLLHRPKLLFLDEPTIGLDAVAKSRLRELIRRRQQQGVTVVLTSHDLGDIEHLCQRIVVVDDGRSIFDGTLEQLRDVYSPPKGLTVSFETPPLDLQARLSTALVGTGARCDVKECGRIAEVTFDTKFVARGKLLRTLVEELPVDDVQAIDPPIEDLIRQVYGGGN